MSSFLLCVSTFIVNSAGINCPDGNSVCGPCTGLSGTDQCSLDCLGQDDCDGDTLICTDNFKCLVSCFGYDTCMNAILNAQQATSLTVHCGEDSGVFYGDCWNLHINAQYVINVSVNCLGSSRRSCERMTLTCGTGICQIICQGNSCADVVIDVTLSSQYVCAGDGCSNVALITSNPTTTNPTTTGPTTSNPTTMQPTTIHPTTANPTTTNPTTEHPTTTQPTTAEPTTVNPTIKPTGDIQVTDFIQPQTTIHDKVIDSTNKDPLAVYLLIGLILIIFIVGIFCITIYKIKTKRNRKMMRHVIETNKVNKETKSTIKTGEVIVTDKTQKISMMNNTTPMSNDDINMSEDEFIIDGDVVQTPDHDHNNGIVPINKGPGSIDSDAYEVFEIGTNKMYSLNEAEGCVSIDYDDEEGDDIITDINAMNHETLQ